LDAQVCHDFSLAGEAAQICLTVCGFEHCNLIFTARLKMFMALSHDHMTGCAGTTTAANVVKVQIDASSSIQNGVAFID
jgi:hypothetical protein